MRIYKRIIDSMVDPRFISHEGAPFKIISLLFTSWLITHFALTPYTKNLLFLQNIDRPALLVPDDVSMFFLVPGGAAAAVFYVGAAVLHFLAYFKISYYSKKKSATILLLALTVSITFFALALNAKLSTQRALQSGEYFTCPYSEHPLFKGLSQGGKRAYPTIIVSKKSFDAC